jgi:hypothetical protein
LRRIVIKTVSHDQGWSSYEDDYGTYRGSWTWFDIVLERPEDGHMTEVYRGNVQSNIHACIDMTTHVVDLGIDHPVVEMARNKDVISVWIRASFSGWTNYVEKITMWTFSVFEVEETDDGER